MWTKFRSAIEPTTPRDSGRYHRKLKFLKLKFFFDFQFLAIYLTEIGFLTPKLKKTSWHVFWFIICKDLCYGLPDMAFFNLGVRVQVPFPKLDRKLENEVFSINNFSLTV